MIELAPTNLGNKKDGEKLTGGIFQGSGEHS